MKYAIVFVGGIGVGLFIAQQYARWKATSSVDSALDFLHLGALKGIADPIVGGLVG